MHKLENHAKYDPSSGRIIWTKPLSNRVKSGDEAGKKNARGYKVFGFDGKTLYCHRAAWYLIYGYWPENDIDHINRDKSDNRIENLREATRTQNNGNVELLNSNSSGFRGVSFEKRREKYAAYIWIENKKKHLGYFWNAELAANAYNEAAKMHFGEFARLNAL